jgi:hypothetical protein
MITADVFSTINTEGTITSRQTAREERTHPDCGDC